MTTMVNLRQDSRELANWTQEARKDIRNVKSTDLIKRLSPMLSEGLIAHKDKKIRKAYVLLTRYLYIVDQLQKRNLDVQLKRELNATAKINQAKELQEAIIRTVNASIPSSNNIPTNSLTNSTNNKSLNKNDSTDNNEDDPLNLPEIPDDDPVSEKVVDDFIPCTELFPIIQAGKRYLIIDIRSLEDYQRSRIKTDKCINIPSSEIVFGKTAKKFELYLQSTSPSQVKLYSERSQKFVDVIVLMDWDTTRLTLKPTSHVSIMREILTKWDPGVALSKHLILHGGFSEWLNVYPSFTTNPRVLKPIPMDNTLDEILDDIRYPDWMTQEGPKAVINYASKNNNNDVSRRGSDIPGLHAKVNDSVLSKRLLQSNQSATKYPSYEDEDVDMKHLSEEIDRLNVEKEKPSRPVIDRSSKPGALAPNPQLELMYSLLTKITSDLKDQEKLERQALQLEYDILAMLTKSSNVDSDDGEDLESTYEQKHTVLQTISAILKSKEEKEAELARISENLVWNGENKQHNKQHTLDSGLRNMKMRLQGLVRQRRDVQQKIEEAEKRREEARLKGSPRHDDTLTVYKEPLKSEGSTNNSGLKRSLSSPNLAKMEDRKVPIIDRSSKPHTVRRSLREANNNISGTSWKDSFKRMDPVYRDGHPGITGLKNLGNSCYMNSIIQCLSNTAYLARYFIDNGYQDDLNTNSDNETRGQIAEEFAQVIKALWRGQYKSIAPRDLKDTIGQFRLQFDSCEQQDSHEFLTFLLEWMHNDLRKDGKMRIDGPLSAAEKEWEKALKGQYSIISRLFMGQLRSTICCTTCSGKSITYETFTSLSISLPEANRCTLDECIRHFLSGQKISGWNCPHCKTAREATKKFDFVKLAPIMVIHLNRFAGTEVGLEKKNTSVVFPLIDLNLKQYLVVDPDSNTLNHPHSYSYNLYGLSNHYGTMGGGHYTAFCKSSALNKWYKYDDHSVSEISEQNVRSQNSYAYLLFYTSLPYESYTYIDESS
ncbi:ubiquitin carboxyl-terminal hydrolase 8 [Diachasma alloeum]|uniref:ubiquitin carboxyl-terminal hydrolase 8 n=1 Tax=Diachasma alloeum TaxID=454923 RepID=UPI0007381B2C|nr:ubiquitin carboxyl-terminal hydrolase 8 [Diachasma alloeum]